MGLWFIASFWNGRYTWGFDYLRYYPVWLRITWLCSGIGLLFTAMLHSEKNRGEVHYENGKKWHLFVLLTVIAVLSIAFRNKIPLLGDSAFRINEIIRGRLFYITEPLTTLVHGLLYKLIARTGKSYNLAELSYIIISIVAGLAVTVVYYFIARKWFKDSKWFGVVFLLSLGLNQIFYGYVESYALFMLGVWCYLWFGVSSLVKKTQLYLATLSCSLTIACHIAGVLLIPSLCFLWWRTLIYKKEINWYKVLMHVLLLLAGLGLTLLLGWLAAGKKQFTLSLAEAPQKPFLPLWQGDGILSFTHLMDILNQLLLVIPGGLFILLVQLLSDTKVRTGRRLTFLFIAFLGALLFILIINPRLGAPRDWDLFAWVGIPIVLLALFHLKKGKNYRAVLVPASVVSLWLFWPWIGVNASEDFSVKRFTTILDNETKLVAYGYENLADFYLHRGQIDKHQEVCKKALMKEPMHARMLQRYARALYLDGKLDSAAEYLMRAVQVDSMKPDYWHDLGLMLFWLKQHEQALFALQRSLALDSHNPGLLYDLGTLYLKLTQWENADSAFFLARKFGHDEAWLYFFWGETQLQLGQFEKAMQNLKKALDRGIQEERVVPLYKKAVAGLKKRKGLKSDH